MDNPERGEVGFKFGNKTLTLKFSNAGKRIVESELDVESSMIVAKISTGQIGDRMISALLLGATRKHHARQFRSMNDVDEFLDELADSEDFGELQIELVTCLVAAYMRVPKESVLVGLFGRDEDEDDGDPEDPKEESPPKRTRTPKKS